MRHPKHKFFSFSVTLLVAVAMNVCMCFAGRQAMHPVASAASPVTANEHGCCAQQSTSDAVSNQDADPDPQQTSQDPDPCEDCNIKHAPTPSTPDPGSDGVPPLTLLPDAAVPVHVAHFNGWVGSVALIGDSPPLLQDLFHTHCLLTC